MKFFGWNTTSCLAVWAIIGIAWMPEDFVPTIPTRLPSKSTGSCGQRAV